MSALVVKLDIEKLAWYVTLMKNLITIIF